MTILAIRERVFSKDSEKDRPRTNQIIFYFHVNGLRCLHEEAQVKE